MPPRNICGPCSVGYLAQVNDDGTVSHRNLHEECIGTGSSDDHEGSLPARMAPGAEVPMHFERRIQPGEERLVESWPGHFVMTKVGDIDPLYATSEDYVPAPLNPDHSPCDCTHPERGKPHP